MKKRPQTVVCYLRQNDSYLLLYRNKKKNDYNHDKWIGVGGHLEENETPDLAAIREVKEETGLNVNSLSLMGEILFIDNDYEETMFVYEITDFSGSLIECDEGELRWIPIKDIYHYPMWEGDKAFLPRLINHDGYFKMRIEYSNGELISVSDL